MTTTLERPTEMQISTIKVAVLPFVNMSADPAFEYFSDGVSEDIIDTLNASEGLKLISRGSSFALKNEKLEINEIGQSLKVDFVVCGTLRRIGKKVRMRVYLNEAGNGAEVWSKSYDQPVADIFHIEADIIDHLWEHMVSPEQKAEWKKPEFKPATTNLAAYEHYLQGLFHHNKWTMQALSTAVACYQRAIKKEPDYYLAYAMMANAYTRLSFVGSHDTPVKSYDEAQEAAERAIDLNPNYYRSYMALSYVYLYQKYDWEQALMMVNRAIKLNPTSSKSHVAKSLYYTVKGNFTESRKLLEKALELDPFSFMAKRAVADNYFLERKYDKAIELYDELIEIDPYHEKVLEYRAWAVVMKGEIDEAIATFRSFDNQTKLTLKSYSQLGYAFAKKGDTENAERYLAEIKKSAAIHKSLTYALDFAVVHTALGNFEKAMDYLEEAVENRRSAIIYTKVHPIWDPMRKHPRFKALVKRLLLD
ncbi:MAG: tetratricopeptide repeat protein [Cyclobacteriaceae bacterium]